MGADAAACDGPNPATQPAEQIAAIIRIVPI
jgi:hypothetical protein